MGGFGEPLAASAKGMSRRTYRIGGLSSVLLMTGPPLAIFLVGLYLLFLWYRLRIRIHGDDVPWGPLTMEVGCVSGVRTFDLLDSDIVIDVRADNVVVVNKATGERTKALGVDGVRDGRNVVSSMRFSRFVTDLDSVLSQREGATMLGVVYGGQGTSS